MASPFDRPELMVVGDSLPQGCRSLSVTRRFCAESYPKQAADLLGLNLEVPGHPREVLFDLEELVGDLIFSGVPAFLRGIASNYREWKEGFRGPVEEGVWHDNLAVAGFTLEDSLGEPLQADGRTRARGTAELADAWLKETEVLDLRQGMGLLSDLHIAVNARYVLNPGNDPKRAAWSQLDWVKARKPQRLIVHVGHNNGLYAVGSEGDPEEWQRNWSGPTARALAAYRRMVERLAAELPETRILYVTLPKVGAVANLMPVGGARLAEDMDYFDLYETQFPFRKVVRGGVVREMDAEIRRANAGIEALVANASGGRGEILDAYRFFAALDTKNTGETPVTVGGRTLDNHYIRGDFRRVPGKKPTAPQVARWEFAGGGLQSIDGMHPTAVGYALLAFEVVRILGGEPVTEAVRRRHLERMVRAERLVSRYPQGFDTVQKLLGRFSHPGQTDEEKAFNETLRGAAHVVA